MPHNTESIQPRFWLITAPRTASNMLVKMLNLDEQGVRPAWHGGYFFMNGTMRRMMMLTKSMSEWTEEETKELEAVHQECFDKLQDYVEAAEKEGQKIFVKEHAMMFNQTFFESQYNFGAESVAGKQPSLLAQRGVENPTRSSHNITWLPDEFLQLWKPTFLIRNPAMMLPSLYRTCLNEAEAEGFRRPTNEPMLNETTMKWNRTLFDFYENYYSGDSQWPIVLDADDVMTNPAVVLKYAELAGLDAEKVRFSWDKASEETLKSLSSRESRMLSSINASSKVDSSKVAGNIDLDKEAAKWREEFGEEGGRKLERWVREAMPHYEYMHARRLRLE